MDIPGLDKEKYFDECCTDGDDWPRRTRPQWLESSRLIDSYADVLMCRTLELNDR